MTLRIVIVHRIQGKLPLGSFLRNFKGIAAYLDITKTRAHELNTEVIMSCANYNGKESGIYTIFRSKEREIKHLSEMISQGQRKIGMYHLHMYISKIPSRLRTKFVRDPRFQI